MLNLMRVLGTSLGVATASSTLAWRLEAATGAHDSWISFAGRPLLGAVESSLAMLVVMAVAAGAVSSDPHLEPRWSRKRHRVLRPQIQGVTAEEVRLEATSPSRVRRLIIAPYVADTARGRGRRKARAPRRWSP